MCTKDCLINSIDMLRQEAWQKAIKYRFDPVIGKIHEENLQNLNTLLDHATQEKEHESIR